MLWCIKILTLDAVYLGSSLHKFQSEYMKSQLIEVQSWNCYTAKQSRMRNHYTEN